MPAESIILCDERVGDAFRYLAARLTAEGDLSIEGQDIDPGCGSGQREYEWGLTIRAVNIPQLIAALGGTDEANILSLLAERYSKDAGYASTAFLEEHGIPVEFWSHIGD